MQISELLTPVYDAAWLPWAVQYFFLVGISATTALTAASAFGKPGSPARRRCRRRWRCCWSAPSPRPSRCWPTCTSRAASGILRACHALVVDVAGPCCLPCFVGRVLFGAAWWVGRTGLMRLLAWRWPCRPCPSWSTPAPRSWCCARGSLAHGVPAGELRADLAGRAGAAVPGGALAARRASRRCRWTRAAPAQPERGGADGAGRGAWPCWACWAWTRRSMPRCACSANSRSGASLAGAVATGFCIVGLRRSRLARWPRRWPRGAGADHAGGGLDLPLGGVHERAGVPKYGAGLPVRHALGQRRAAGHGGRAGSVWRWSR